MLIATLPISAATADTGDDSAGETTLRLQPTLCAIAKEQRLCRQEVLVTWRLSEAASPCLHRTDLVDALYCWRQQSKGQIQVLVESAKDVVFVLKEGEHALAETVFRILWEDQQRRRRRKPWQFF